jgi:hypothetical protein
MRVSRWLCLAFVMSISVVAVAGDIQVFCEPGLRVFLDGEFVGTSSAREDGLFLMNVSKGGHSVRLEKDGFLSQSIEVDVLNLPIEVTTAEFLPVPVIAEEVQPEQEEVQETAIQKVGTLVVTSAPQYCFVEIDGKVEEKRATHLTIGGLAAGKHSITYRKEGWEPITGLVTVEPGADVTVRGNFKSGEVEIIYEGKGSLRIMSKPNRCTVRFLGMIKEKTDAKLNMSHLPAGEHPILVAMKGRELTTTVWIKSGHRTILEVSFLKGDEPFVASYVPE